MSPDSCKTPPRSSGNGCCPDPYLSLALSCALPPLSPPTFAQEVANATDAFQTLGDLLQAAGSSLSLVVSCKVRTLSPLTPRPTLCHIPTPRTPPLCHVPVTLHTQYGHTPHSRLTLESRTHQSFTSVYLYLPRPARAIAATGMSRTSMLCTVLPP
jgi:hypothetical protein